MEPFCPDQHIQREIEHIHALRSRIADGWTVTGLRLVKDPRTSTDGKVFTFFPHEQVDLMKALTSICDDRLAKLEERKASLAEKRDEGA